jgi:two-component system, NtrC family, nitrogen regulation sensor histidine kinase NtrY
MRLPSSTERRVVFAILLTALIPLAAALLIARAIIARVSATAFQPEFGTHLDQALGVYADLAKAIKQGMHAEAEAIAASGALPIAVSSGDPRALDAALARAFEGHPALTSLSVETCSGSPLGARQRERPLDPRAERSLTVRRSLGPGFTGEITGDLECAADRPEDPKVLVATFATPRGRFDEIDEAQAFAQTYHQIETRQREANVDEPYRWVFAVLFGATIALAVAAGIVVTRPVTRRIARLAAATRPVADGDLSVRVRLEGDDEVADLGRAFDRMLEELDRSRSRIEFLKRIGEWQKMARRLAHEIKNPLTPIQLAVEECHRRYAGDDAGYKRLLETTFEVVEEEVGTLRRLVGEFSSFARLPRAELRSADLGELLRQQRSHFAAFDPPSAAAPAGSAEDDLAFLARVDVVFDIPEEPMPAALDLEALHRVLTNLLRNAAQALRDARPGQARWGRIEVHAAAGEGRYTIDVDDDGPGIPAGMRDSIFDPYVTTKRDGTGLGLSIVKKIVVDHGGGIEALESPLGGARFRVQLPAAGTADSRAAIERSAEAAAAEAAPPSSRRLGG